MRRAMRRPRRVGLILKDREAETSSLGDRNADAGLFSERSGCRGTGAAVGRAATEERPRR